MCFKMSKGRRQEKQVGGIEILSHGQVCSFITSTDDDFLSKITREKVEDGASSSSFKRLFCNFSSYFRKKSSGQIAFIQCKFFCRERDVTLFSVDRQLLLTYQPTLTLFKLNCYLSCKPLKSRPQRQSSGQLTHLILRRFDFESCAHQNLPVID